MAKFKVTVTSFAWFLTTYAKGQGDSDIICMIILSCYRLTPSCLFISLFVCRISQKVMEGFG